MSLTLDKPPADWTLDWAASKPQHNLRSFDLDSRKSVVTVLAIWEGYVENREDDQVFVRLRRENQELFLDFPLSAFELGGPVESGCTFEAKEILDCNGLKTWRHYPHPAGEISPEEIECWKREAQEFAGSGL